MAKLAVPLPWDSGTEFLSLICGQDPFFFRWTFGTPNSELLASHCVCGAQELQSFPRWVYPWARASFVHTAVQN